MKLDNFFTSGWLLDTALIELRSKYQMTNIALLTSGFALFLGIISNYIRELPSLIPLEIFLLSTNIAFFFILRHYKNALDTVSFLITSQFTFLFLLLIYISEPSQLKHIWIFTYPIILLYLQKAKYAAVWFIILLSGLLLAPFQSFMEIQYSLFQIAYILVGLVIISLITYFYQLKMTEAKDIILVQQNQLLDVNRELEKQVQELKDKDRILTTQSKQAVMGEMITMIAHQWRQPLSTITLQISNLEVRKLLGEEVSREDVDKTFNEINSNVMYLSETIDDFQTYFRQDKERTYIEVQQLLDKAVNFILPRLQETKIKILFDENEEIMITTYMNELIQVILNLLNNAIDVMSELNCDTSKLIIRVKQKDENICISIIDNAGGISQSDLPYIFEPYFSTKGKNGTGLGLYMSQMIVQKQFNGNIEVETSSKGTNFTIKLPINLS